MSAFYDLIQTFYVVPDAVNGANEVMLTSLDLFFKQKPESTQNISGLTNPGISVWICEVSNNSPSPEKVLKNSIVTVDYDRINTSGNSESVTGVSFESPVVLRTGFYYGIVIKYDDPAFDVWVNKQGDKLVSTSGITNINSSGSQGKFDGILYKPTTANEHLPISDQDLKFKVKIARFISSEGSFSLVNKSYEFFTIDSTSESFIGGETVYQDIPNSFGTINISSRSLNVTGNSTNFTSYNTGQKIVVQSGNNTNVLEIDNINDDLSLRVTSMPTITGNNLSYKISPTAEVYHVDYAENTLCLVNSTAANNTFRFKEGIDIIGSNSKATANLSSIDRYKVDSFNPKLSISNPLSSNFRVSYSLTDSSNSINSSFTNLELMRNNQTNKEQFILSRSQEVTESNLFGTAKKSAVINVSFNVNEANTNLFSVPYINRDELDFYVYQNEINSTSRATLYGIEDYDTEVEKNGLARSKYIAKKISFAEDRFAEDIRVYLSAYRPSGTTINVYAKIHNNADRETFDDKKWTPLELKGNIDSFSGSDRSDIIEYTYGLPQYPEIRNTLGGFFNTALNSNVITTTQDFRDDLFPLDEIRVYNPLIPENHEVFVVEAVTNNSITINKELTNNNIIGSVFVDRLKYKNVAWNNIANDNIARYINTDGVEFDTFSSMQIKIVYLSDNSHIVPSTEQIQAIGVSA